MFLAKFAEANDIVVSGADGDAALRALQAHGVVDTPARLVELPDGLFCAEVRWSDPDGEQDDENPANVAEGGLALEPFDACADWLEIEANATNVLETRAMIEGAPTEPAPEGSGG